jgi:hypothetical protein
VQVDFKASTRVQGTVIFFNYSATAVFRMPMTNQYGLGKVDLAVNQSGQWSKEIDDGSMQGIGFEDEQVGRTGSLCT